MSVWVLIMLNLSTFFPKFIIHLSFCVCVCDSWLHPFVPDNLNTQEQEKEAVMRALPLRSGKTLLLKTWRMSRDDSCVQDVRRAYYLPDQSPPSCTLLCEMGLQLWQQCFCSTAAFLLGFASEKTGRKLVDRSWGDRNRGFLCTCYYCSSASRVKSLQSGSAVGVSISSCFFFFSLLI